MKQFKSILDLLRAFPDEKSCEDYLEKQRWPDGKIISPFDPTSKVYRCKDKFKCKKTSKKFSVRTGTIFESSNLPLQKFFVALFLFSGNKRGISSHQLTKSIDVTQGTAWFVLQRLRDAFEEPAYLQTLEGIIQVDETFVGGKNKNRHRDKKFTYSGDREFKDKVPVMGFADQNGMIRCVAVKDTKRISLEPVVRAIVKPESIVVTDEWKAYKRLSDTYHHETVDHTCGLYTNDSGFTTNKIESFWSHLKRTLHGTYINVQQKNLQRYCNEISFRYNTRDMSTQDRFDMVLKNSEGRLKYSDLVKENKTRYNYQFSN